MDQITEQSHNSVVDEIDLIYRECIAASGEAQSYISCPRGNVSMVFTPFLKLFWMLYLHTCRITTIADRLKDSEGMDDELRSFFEWHCMRKEDLKKCLKLHQYYSGLLVDSGVVTPKRGGNYGR